MNSAMAGFLGHLAENGPLLGQQRSTQQEGKVFPRVHTDRMIIFLQCWKNGLCFTVMLDLQHVTVIILGARTF